MTDASKGCSRNNILPVKWDTVSFITYTILEQLTIETDSHCFLKYYDSVTDLAAKKLLPVLFMSCCDN